MQISNDGNADLPAKVIQLYDEAIRRDPGLAYPLYRKADALSAVKQFPGPDRAQGLLELDRITLRAINLSPQDARAWDARAEALLQQQRWDAALEASTTSVRLDPSNPTLLHDRAYVLMWVGRPAEALPELPRAAFTASKALTRPAPKSFSRTLGAIALAVRMRIRRTSAGVSFGFRSISSAATPLTSAAATEVPVVS